MKASSEIQPSLLEMASADSELPSANPAGELGAAFDEGGAVRALQKDAQSIARRLEAFTALKPADADVVDALEGAVAALPAGAEVAAAIDEMRARAASVVQRARARRVDAFRPVEAAFVQAQRDKSESMRESGSASWRIGPVELELRRERAEARARYNHEPITKWTPIRTVADLEKLVSDARRLLDRAAIPAEILSRAFSEAYEHLRSRGTKGSSNMGRVPLQQFFLEVRVALLRHELTAGRPDKKISQSEWPKWAFLYNADRYRRNLSNLPPERRLSFETGSTADNARGLSMVFNGLEANEDYRSYCYIHAAGADR